VWRCLLFLGLQALLLFNLRSPVGLRTSSDDLDHLLFVAAFGVLSILLFQSARRLRKPEEIVFLVFGTCGILFSAFGLIASQGFIWAMTRGQTFHAVLATATWDSDRVVAIQVETFPAGAYVVVKRQHKIFPGLLVTRLIASIDIPSIDEMVVTPQRKLCVKTDLSHMGPMNDRRYSFALPVEPLVAWRAAPLVTLENWSTFPSCDLG
jgi:hypothetical protein